MKTFLLVMLLAIVLPVIVTTSYVMITSEMLIVVFAPLVGVLSFLYGTAKLEQLKRQKKIGF